MPEREEGTLGVYEGGMGAGGDLGGGVVQFVENYVVCGGAYILLNY